ncbi:MAG: histidine kinase [Bacteroidetes bacterium]|nr:histidine kinase [Bacteroidota bacterium]
MFTNRYRYWLIIILAVYSYLNSLFSEVYTYYHISLSWYYPLIAFLLITFFVWESNRFLQKMLNILSPNISGVAYLAVFFLSGMIAASILSIATVWMVNLALLHLSFQQWKMPAKLAFTYGTRINLFLHILNATAFYIGQYKRKQLETEELKRANAQAQLQAIKNQVNPHFLFNNLNVLSTLIMQENPEANKFIEEFSKVYRHVLNAQQHELITLQSELEFINPYIFLLQKRFPESIIIDMHVNPEYLSWQVVPVSVQMLVENAIKHNIASRQKPLKIVLSANGDKKLTVTNILQEKTNDDVSTHIGLQNIARRYEMITDRNIDIVKTSDSFSVSLPLIEPER